MDNKLYSYTIDYRGHVASYLYMILLIEIMCRDQPAYRHRRKYFSLLTCADSSQFLVNSLELTVDTQICLDYAIASLNQQHIIEDIRQYTMI